MIKDCLDIVIDNIDIKYRANIVKRLESKNVKYPSFRNLSKVPFSILVNYVKKDVSNRKKFFESITEEYSKDNKIDEKNIDDEINKVKETKDKERIVALLSYFISLSSKLDISDIQEIKIIQNLIDMLDSDNIQEEKTLEDVKNKKIIFEEVDNMKTYLGYISWSSTFCNFYPMYIVEENKLIKIDNANELFPQYGNIKLHSRNGNDAKKFFDKDIYIFKLDQEDIEENINLKTKEPFTSHNKIDVDKDCFDINRKYSNNRKIFRLNEFGLYPVVTAKNNKVDFTLEKRIDVSEQYIKEERVVLFYNGNHYGPFELKCRDYDMQYYIDTDIEKNNYIIPKLTVEDNNIDPIFYFRIESNNGDNEVDLFYLNDKINKSYQDVISDDILIKEFSSLIPSIKNNFSDIGNINSPLINLANNEIKQNRLQRIKNVFDTTNIISENYEEITTAICSLVHNLDEDDGILDELANKIVSNTDLLSKIQGNNIIEKEIQNKKRKKNDLEKNIKDLQKEFDNLNSQKNEYYNLISKNTLDEKISELSNDIQEKEKEYKEKTEELEKILNSINIGNDIQGLTYNKDFLLRENKKLEKDKDKMIDAIDSYLQDKPRKIVDSIIDENYAGLISQKISKSIADYKNSENKNDYKKIKNLLQSIQVETKSKEELIDYLCYNINKYRPKYDRNTIINMFICLMQGFITIFSGEPGIGKTSICKYIAKVLGSTSISKNIDIPNSENDFNQIQNYFIDRFVTIPVQRGWTSKKDLIGYYNPLSNNFEKNDDKLFEALNILDIEKDDSSLPMIVLLDEANLSPLEYYWSDFMNLCDRLGDTTVYLGGEKTIYIPETLRFLATVNNDYTTENMSPRLIDRAWIISLPDDFNMDNIEELNLECEIISWSNLKACFDCCENQYVVDDNLEKRLKTIDSKFRKVNQRISYRTLQSVKKYCYVGENLFNSDDDIVHRDSDIIALDYAVSQKIITKISGTGEKYKEFIEELIDYCKELRLVNTVKILEKILQKGNNYTQYYNFFD